MGIETFEKILLLLVVLVWLGPFLYSLKNRHFNLFHPQFAIPAYISYFTINSMVEKWYQWMIETDPGIIVTTETNLKIHPDYFIQPLLILLFAGFFYHLGCRILSPSIARPTSMSLVNFGSKEVVQGGSKIEFIILVLCFSAIAWIPNYLLPNAGLGSFWTYPLALSLSFIPVLLFKVNKYACFISIIFLLIAVSNLKSKAALVYPFLPISFYYFFFVYRQKNFFYLLIPLSFIVFLWTLLSIGGFDFVLAKLFHRDYQFDVFAALVHHAPNGHLGNFGSFLTGIANGPVGSWTLAEFIEGIPTILNPYKVETINPAKLVTETFLHPDFLYLPNAYYNRHLLFSGYYDFGIIGAMLSAFFFGLFYSFFWRLTSNTVRKENLLWPIFVYLPIPTISTYFVASGGITYGLINAFVPATCILILVFLSKGLLARRRYLYSLLTK